MSTVISIICAILIFCVIVVVHEFGHFIVARKCGIDVKEFAIGMGPAIFKSRVKHAFYHSYPAPWRLLLHGRGRGSCQREQLPK